MNKIRMAAGTYVADTDLVLARFHQRQQLDYAAIRAGEVFDVPQGANGFWWAVTYHPDFGDEWPKFRRRVSEKPTPQTFGPAESPDSA